MCNHVYVIMHVKVPQLSVVGVGLRVPIAGFCLSLYSLTVLNKGVNMIQTTIQTSILYGSSHSHVVYVAFLISNYGIARAIHSH